MQNRHIRTGILLAALAFVAVQLHRNQAWDADLWLSIPDQIQPHLLLAGLSLMPLNLSLEIVKWCRLTGRPLPHGARDVLAGAAAGFVSPNRIGDGIARVVRLPADLRERGVRASLSSSFAQSWCTLAFGAWAFGSRPALAGGLAALSVLGVAAYLVWTPRVGWLPRNWSAWLEKRITWQADAPIPIRLRLTTLGLSALRYAVFSAQYLLILRAFRVATGFRDIAGIWLVNTVIPTGALGEFGVREASALSVIQPADGFAAASIVAATLITWTVNLLIPGLVGIRFIARNHVVD